MLLQGEAWDQTGKCLRPFTVPENHHRWSRCWGWSDYLEEQPSEEVILIFIRMKEDKHCGQDIEDGWGDQDGGEQYKKLIWMNTCRLATSGDPPCWSHEEYLPAGKNEFWFLQMFMLNLIMIGSIMMLVLMISFWWLTLEYKGPRFLWGKILTVQIWLKIE